MITTSPIPPTIGRTVYFSSDNAAEAGNVGAIVPAIITHVWGNDCVNLMVMRDGGGQTPVCVTSVGYVEPDSSPAATLPNRGWWWMPYQKAVAAERDPVSGQRVAGAAG